MKLLFILVVLMIVAGSFFADYKWKQWVARQKAERELNERSPDRPNY